MQNTRRIMAVSVALIILAAVHGQNLMGAVAVGTCEPSLVSFTTIQAAVNASPTGGTILICPGTYPEQVAITKALTLKGVPSGTSDSAVVASPAGGVVANTTSYTSGNPLAAQILVKGATPVNISNLAVDGTNNGISSCLPDLIGILYQNSSGTLKTVATRNQILSPYISLGGCQNGLGIFVQSDGIGGTSTVTVTGSSVHSYQKNGITGNEPGTKLAATGNQVVGLGPVSGAAENGIQIGFGATGSITSNSTIDDVWAPDVPPDVGDAADGILIYAAQGVTISGNTVGNTQFGIALVTDQGSGTAGNLGGVADNATVTGNKVTGTHLWDAIDACSNGNTITKNLLTSADESGVHLDTNTGCGGAANGSGATGNTNIVQSNTINETCAGVLMGTGSSGNAVTPNTFSNVTTTLLSGDTCTSSVAEMPSRKSGSISRPRFSPARP